MKIKRNVNGQELEFELTSDECMKTYYEWQELIDKDDTQFVLKEMGLFATEQQVDEIVDIYRDYMSNEDNWMCHLKRAIREALNK